MTGTSFVKRWRFFVFMAALPALCAMLTSNLGPGTIQSGESKITSHGKRSPRRRLQYSVDCFPFAFCFFVHCVRIVCPKSLVEKQATQTHHGEFHVFFIGFAYSICR